MKDIKINYDQTYTSKYGRDYYRGQSFHYAGKWKVGAKYVADSYNTDFVSYRNWLLVCKKSHTASTASEPTGIAYDSDKGYAYGLDSQYWDIVIPTDNRMEEIAEALTRDYTHKITISAEELRIAYTELIRNTKDEITEEYNSVISQTAREISSTVEHNKILADEGFEQMLSKITQTAEEINSRVDHEVATLNGTIDHNHSEISQRADAIVSTVEQYKIELGNTIEQNKSEINQRADSIVSTVEQYKTELDGTIAQNKSEINQRADGIVSTVESYKEELDGTIETNRSEINQRADSIEQTVANNKTDADGKITNLDSKITQTASEIRSEVNEAVTELNGTIETNNSTITQRADEIEATVTSNKQAAEDALDAVNEELSSRITQNAEAISTEVSDRLISEGEIIADYDSKFEQTAQSISTEVSAREAAIEGVQTDYNSKFQQTAQDIQTEVSARETSEAGIVNDYNSKITQTASEINATVTANKQATDDAISALDEELSSKITQNAEAITAEVNARISSEDEIIEDYTSKIQQTADTITSEVTARKASESELVEDYESKISQTATEIRTEITENIETIDGRLTTAESNITQNANSISAQVSRLNNFETSVGNTFTIHQELLNSLQTQVDGAIETYFAEGLPTLQNYPADDWDTDEIKEIHVGDIYYDKNTGYSYRFLKENGNYIWFRILDSDITTAIANAAAAQETADGKMTIFYTQPSTYCEGDLWIYEENGEVLIKRSEYDRTNNYVSTDWVLVSDVANATKVRAAFEILADMIRSEVGEYTSNNDLVPGSLYSYITQSRSQISAKIATAKGEAITTSDNNTDGKLSTLNDDLLDTGIDITNKKIELTADNIVLKNNSGQRGLELVTGSDGKPLIDVTNLNVSGIFTTSAWNNTSNDLLTTAQDYADTAESNAKTTAASDATSKANIAKNDAIAAAKAYSDSADYLASIKPTINSGMATSNDLAGYEYLKTALTKGSTAIGGGLVLSSLIQLGGPTNNWQVWSGLNGVRNSDTDIAFWAGGEMSETGNRAAKSVIRMDGSGYLANKNITWDNTGSASFTGNITAKSITFAEGVKIDADYINGLSTDDITGLDNLDYVKSIKVGTTSYTRDINGIVSLPAYPTTLPASDVYSWAKASTKPSYSYSEISGTPTIPTVNNATLTIQKNSVNIGTFTANASSNVTVNITVPTKVSELTNDAGYITTVTAVGSLITNATTGQTASSGESMSGNITLHKISKTGSYNDLLNKPSIPTKTSQLTNDSGFLTSHQSLSGYATESWVTNRGYITGITKDMVTTALGYTPPTSDTNTWRPIGTGATDAAAGNHTHVTSIDTSSGTNQLTLAFGTKYAITAGGTSYVFTMPANPNTDTNTTYSLAGSTNSTTQKTTLTLTPSSGSAQTVTFDTVNMTTLNAQYARIDDLVANKLKARTVDVRTNVDVESTRIAYIGDTNYPIYAGGNSSSNATFKVDANGNLTATGANITGVINAESGSITGQLNLGADGCLTTNHQSYSSYYSSTFDVHHIEFGYSDPVHGSTSSYSQLGPGSLKVSCLNTYTTNYKDDEVNITYNTISRRIKESPTMVEYTEYPLWGLEEYSVRIVSSIPSSPDSNTLYFVTS